MSCASLMTTTVQGHFKFNLYFDNLNFDNMYLNVVNFKGNNLNKASFKNAILGNANFEYTNLQNTNFSNADLRSSIMINLDLKGVNFSGANLGGVNFSNSDLTGANFKGANIQNVKFDNTKLDKTGIIIIKASNHDIIYFEGKLQIGCEHHNIEHWFENSHYDKKEKRWIKVYEKLGKENKYGKKQIIEYFTIINKLREK